MKTTLVGVWMVLQFTTFGQEDDGTINYLFESNNPRKVEYAVAFSTPKVLPLDLNAFVPMKLWMTCTPSWTLDGDENKPRHGDWGSPRRAFHCNADKIRIGHETFIYQFGVPK